MKIQNFFHAQNISSNFSRSYQNNVIRQNPLMLSKDTVQFKGNVQNTDNGDFDKRIPNIKRLIKTECDSALELKDSANDALNVSFSAFKALEKTFDAFEKDATMKKLEIEKDGFTYIYPGYKNNMSSITQLSTFKDKKGTTFNRERTYNFNSFGDVAYLNIKCINQKDNSYIKIESSPISKNDWKCLEKGVCGVNSKEDTVTEKFIFTDGELTDYKKVSE